MGKQIEHAASDRPVSKPDRQRFMASILSRPILQVISDYIDEILDKDQAYRFIIKQGLMDEFRRFCNTENRSRSR
jgi:hypothetical protein